MGLKCLLDVNESFHMHSMLICTINDFPTILLGYRVKDRKTCSVSEENTSYEQLKHGKKIIIFSIIDF